MAADEPHYARRYTRILAALRILQHYPNGLPLVVLAGELEVPAAALRDELLAYYTAEPTGGTSAAYRLPGIDWVTAGEQADPQEAEVVVLTDPSAMNNLGVAFLRSDEVATLWQAGSLLLQFEPDNEDLAQAAEILGGTWLDGAPVASEEDGTALDLLLTAIKKKRAVEITYSRRWRPGVDTRKIHPYRLIHTHNGWELDAGPLDKQGQPRTFLLSNIRDLTATQETFVVPDRVEEIIAANRESLSVVVQISQRGSWALDSVADRAVVLSSDEEMARYDVTLSPPYVRRLALILAAVKGDGWIEGPQADELTDEVRAFAAQLLEHHGFHLP